MILTGFILPGPYISVAWWQWLYDITYCHWALSFLIANETRSEQYQCEGTQTIPFASSINQGQCDLSFDPFAGSAANPYSEYYHSPINDPASQTDGWKCRYDCGYDLMQTYGVQWSYHWMASYEVILWCFGLFFAVIAAFALAYINHIKR